MTGYESKRAAAQDKTIDQVNWADHEPDGLSHLARDKLLDDDDTQLYQDDALTIAYQSGYYDGKKAAQPAQEPVAWMYPAAQCDRACLYVCTAGFTQFPECASAPPQDKNT